MSRYQEMFSRIAREKRAAFIPFVMLLDPDRVQSLQIIKVLVEEGADALELGIAFSDPVADGPAIEKAALRVFRQKHNVGDAFLHLSLIRKTYPKLPLGLLTYANLCVRMGISQFYSRAKISGADSVLLADVPTIEAEYFSNEAIRHGIDPVLIATSQMSKEKILTLSKNCRGYTYVVTRPGVTGTHQEIALRHVELLQELLKVKAPPAVFGFGISTPEHVAKALNQGACGVITGSRIAEIIEANLNDQTRMLADVREYARIIKRALKTN